MGRPKFLRTHQLGHVFYANGLKKKIHTKKQSTEIKVLQIASKGWLLSWQASIWNTDWHDQCENTCLEEMALEQESFHNKDVVYGLTVKDAVLFPPEVETGIWPDNYNLSDHAPLTVTFSPAKIFA